MKRADLAARPLFLIVYLFFTLRHRRDRWQTVRRRFNYTFQEFIKGITEVFWLAFIFRFFLLVRIY